MFYGTHEDMLDCRSFIDVVECKYRIVLVDDERGLFQYVAKLTIIHSPNNNYRKYILLKLYTMRRIY